MSTYQVAVRFANGEKALYKVGACSSHEEARRFVMDTVIGVRSAVASLFARNASGISYYALPSSK